MPSNLDPTNKAKSNIEKKMDSVEVKMNNHLKDRISIGMEETKTQTRILIINQQDNNSKRIHKEIL